MDFEVAKGDVEKVRQAAHELGIEIADTTEIRGTGGDVFAGIALVAADPMVQGALCGFLIAQGVVIEKTDKGGIRITITSLEKLKKFIDKFR